MSGDAANQAAADWPSGTVAFLFTDIEASTKGWEAAPDMSEHVESHFVALHAAVEAQGGVVFASMGDGIAAAFPTAEAAIEAAILAQMALAGSPFRARMGVHVGPAERIGDDYRGRALNRAARVMAAGHGGQILASDAAAVLLRNARLPRELLDVGHHRLRDLAEPERLWQVVHPDLEHTFPPLRGVDSYVTNLPTFRSSFVGRERELVAVAQRLRTNRVVTLTGTGGVGKTRLATHVGAELLPEMGAVWFIELANVVDADAVAPAVALAIGVPGPGGSTVAAVATAIGHRPALLIVDNCEHVLDAVADLVDRLTIECPGVTVLATSREPLALEGEQVVVVRSLDPVGAAADLFRQRSEAAGALVGDDEAQLVEDICRRLDGIPLAIELAATRVAGLGLRTIRDGLDDRFALLSGGRRRVVERHHTLRAAVDWSYRLLSADERALFRLLGIFSGGFELDAAADVQHRLGGDDHGLPQRLASLVDRSMVVAEPATSGVRYRLLETLRAFALEELDQQNETEAATMAHGQWVAAIADVDLVDWMTADAMRRALRLEREVENWRDAVAAATRRRDLDLIVRLCGTATTYLLLGRPDLAPNVEALDILFEPSDVRRRQLSLVMGSASMARLDIDGMKRWRAVASELGGDEATGVFLNLESLIALLEGDVETCIRIRANALDTVHLQQGARDFLLCTALFWAASFGRPDLVQPSWLAAATDIFERSDVPIVRYNAAFGLAWALALESPEQSQAYGRRAVAEIEALPSFFRQTSRAGAIRFFISESPQLSAATALDALSPPSRHGAGTVEPLLAATVATLLVRTGHPLADDAVATLSRTTAATWMQLTIPDLAQRRDRGAFIPPDTLVERMRSVLAEIAAR